MNHAEPYTIIPERLTLRLDLMGHLTPLAVSRLCPSWLREEVGDIRKVDSRTIDRTNYVLGQLRRKALGSSRPTKFVPKPPHRLFCQESGK